MTISIEGPIAYLHGDLTHSGVTQNIIESLAVSLRKMDARLGKCIRIDCRQILSADISGLQLLYVWMQCARLQGVEPRLVNLSEGLQHDMHRMGLNHCFSSNLEPCFAEANQ